MHLGGMYAKIQSLHNLCYYLMEKMRGNFARVNKHTYQVQTELQRHIQSYNR